MNALLFAKDLVMGKTASSNAVYYFNRLSATGKSVYQAMDTGIKSFFPDINIPFAPQNEISKAFDALLWDNPMFFYTSSYTITSSAQKKLCIFKPNYLFAPHTAKQYKDRIIQYLQQFNGIQGMADMEKELYVHDFCLNNFKYDYAFGEHAYSVLGPVMKGAAVCEGISKFVKLALDHLRVKNIIVHGNASGPMQGTNSKHAWNIVKISGQTFHLDVTFNLSQTTAQNRYDYFNLSDEEIKKDHSFANDFPKCVTSDMDYYNVHGMTANSPAELGVMIGNNLRQGKKITIVKIKNATDAANILNKVAAVADKQFRSFSCNQSIMVEVRYNPVQMVFEVEYT